MTRILLTTTAVALIASVIGLRASPPSAQAQSTSDIPQTIVVTGQGESTGTPEISIVTLSVQNEAPTARQAIDQNSAAMAAVVEAMKRIGIPDRGLRTSGISVNPVRARQQPGDTQPPPIVAYQAVNSLTVTSEPATKAGEVIDVGIGAGANVAGGIRFAMKDDAALHREALDMAVKSARNKADAMAAAAGLRIVGIRTMTEEGGPGVPVVRAEAQSLATADSRTVPVQPGELTLRTQVRITYTFA